jgi:phage terminase large subunit-like protein
VIPKRIFWLSVGYGAGLGSSWYTARKVKAAARRYTPEGLSDRVGERVEDVRAAMVEGRAAMRRREMQLRADLDRSRTAGR